MSCFLLPFRVNLSSAARKTKNGRPSSLSCHTVDTVLNRGWPAVLKRRRTTKGANMRPRYSVGDTLHQFFRAVKAFEKNGRFFSVLGEPKNTRCFSGCFEEGYKRGNVT